MRTTLIERNRRRWQGTLSAVSDLALKVEAAIRERTSIDVETTVRVFTKDAEVEYDSISEFRNGSEITNLNQLNKVILTTGHFAREQPLASEIVLSNVPSEPGVYLKVRGHDVDKVKGLAETIVGLLTRDGRHEFSNSWILGVLLVLYAVLQYLFYAYVGLPELPQWVSYLSILFISVLPTLILLVAAWTIQWLYPQVEFTSERGSTRWSRNKSKGAWALVGIATSIIAPILVTVIQRQLGLD